MPKRGKRPFNDDGAAAKSPAGTASLGDTASQDAKSSAGIASPGTAAAKEDAAVNKEARRVAIQSVVTSRKSPEHLTASGLLGTGRGGFAGVGGATAFGLPGMDRGAGLPSMARGTGRGGAAGVSGAAGAGLPGMERLVERMRIMEGKFETNLHALQSVRDELADHKKELHESKKRICVLENRLGQTHMPVASGSARAPNAGDDGVIAMFEADARSFPAADEQHDSMVRSLAATSRRSSALKMWSNFMLPLLQRSPWDFGGGFEVAAHFTPVPCHDLRRTDGVHAIENVTYSHKQAFFRGHYAPIKAHIDAQQRRGVAADHAHVSRQQVLYLPALYSSVSVERTHSTHYFFPDKQRNMLPFGYEGHIHIDKEHSQPCVQIVGRARAILWTSV